MADVSFICKRTVVSTKPVQLGKFLPLSVLDHVMERNHLHLVFYYNLPIRRVPGELTQKLIESLAKMLSIYPIATGRLVRMPDGHWMIRCNDAGVRLQEARAKGTVNEWLQTVNRKKEMKLVHWEDRAHKPYYWSTFSIQITEFEGGGLAIGLSCTRLLSDPICATLMIKAWADTMLCGEIESPPSFDPLPSSRSGNKSKSHPYCSKLIDHYRPVVGNSAPTSDTKQTTVTLQFNQEKVKDCIAMAITSNADKHDPTLMPFIALTALLWTSISRVKGMKTALLNMSICVDVRKVLGLDKGFFGNCMLYSRLPGNGLDVNRVPKTAELINEAVTRIDIDEVMDLIDWLEGENCENPPWMNGSHLICVNLEEVESSSAVFEGTASPVRTSYYIEPSAGPGPGQIVVLPGDGEYGRVVVVTLPEDEAEKLLEDVVIRQFDPTILMGMDKNCS